VIYSQSQPGSTSMPQQQYEQVAADLRSKIRAGEYPPGTKLPSRSEMRQIYGVSDTVLDKAMFILRTEGLTITLHGVGVWVVEVLPADRPE
jgi:GntR family transcriptional regulator